MLRFPFALKTIVILFFKTYMRNCLKNSGDAVLVIYLWLQTEYKSEERIETLCRVVCKVL